MRAHPRTRGSAIVYALVFASLLGLTALAILATQTRSTRNTSEISNRALERATTDAAIEHGKALVQQALGAQAVELEQLADLNVTNHRLNGLEYRLDLSLAALGSIHADLVGTNQWSAVRMNPHTGEPLRHLTSNVNLEALTLQGEWRDALIHQAPGADPITLGIYQDGVYRRELADTSHIPIPFPELNAPPAQLAARGSTSGTRAELGVLLDATGRVWEWPLDQSATPSLLNELAGITSITSGDRYALALTQHGDLYGWGNNTRGPLRPTSMSMSESLQDITRLDMPIVDGARPALITVASGDNHVIALDSRGRAWSWGANHSQQLGRSCGSVCSADTIQLETDLPIVSVNAGGDRGAALDQAGRLFVWGAGRTPRLLTHPDGAPARITHYSLSASEGLAITQDAKLVRFTNNTTQPLEIRLITNETTGGSTTITRADLIRAGQEHHAAIIGADLITWPANTPGTPTATHQLTPGNLGPGQHENLDNLRVTIGDQSLTLAWDAPEEDLTYQIHHSHDARDWQQAGQTTSPTYHLDNLTNGQPYFLRLTALNPYGEPRYEHTGGPHTPAGPPGTPTNGRITPLHEALELAWDAPPNNGNPITAYRLEQSSNGTVWQTLPYEPTQPHARLTNLENGRPYHHRVTAINSAGRSTPLTLPIGTPQGPPAPPELERADGHSLNGHAAITLTWQPAPGATSYRAHHTRDGGTWTTTTGPSDATSLTITGLQADANYSVYLVAANQHGDSQPSRRLSVTTRNTPSSPRDLSAAPRSDTEALLAWNPPVSGAPITNYRLERREEGGSWRHLSALESETFLDQGLEPGRHYAYRIAAVNASGTGAYTPPMELVTSLTAPSQPGAPKLRYRNQDSLTIAWDAPASAGGATSLTYRLERRQADHGTWVVLTQDHDNTTFTDTTVQPGGTYAYRVTARNQQHDSPTSEETLIAASAALTAPNAPRLTGREHLSISLEWDASSTPSVTAYLLERAEHGSLFTTLTTIPAQAAAIQTYADTRITAGVTYAYRVRAKTADATSEPSPASDDVVALARSAAPNALTATPDTTEGAFQLAWGAPNDAGGAQVIGYRIQRKTNDHEWATIHDHQNPTTSFTDPDAQLGAEHSYRVAAVTTLGANHISPYTPATPPQLLIRIPGQPDAPLVATAPGSFTHPLITWLAPNDGGTPITAYTLERELNSVWSKHATLAGHETQYVDQEAQPGRSYRYRVIVTNAAGDSSASGPSNTYEAHPALGAPTQPHVTHAGTARLHISWAAPPDADPNDVQGYRLERRVGNGEWQTLIASTGPGVLSHDDRGLSVGVAYQYRVAAINQAAVVGATSTPSVVVTAAEPPTVPRSPALARSGDHTLTVEWNAPSADGHASITSYKLQVRTSDDDGTWGAWRSVYEGGNRSFTHTNLVSSLYYQYRVAAANATGESDYAQTASLRAQEIRTITYEFTWSGMWCSYNTGPLSVQTPGDGRWHYAGRSNVGSGGCSAWADIAVAWSEQDPTPAPQCSVMASNVTLEGWQTVRCAFQ